MTIPIIVKIIIAFVMKDLRGKKEPGASRQRLIGVRCLHTLFFLQYAKLFLFFKTAHKGFPLWQHMSKRPDQDAVDSSTVTGAASVMPPVRPRENVMRSPKASARCLRMVGTEQPAAVASMATVTRPLVSES